MPPRGVTRRAGREAGEHPHGARGPSGSVRGYGPRSRRGSHVRITGTGHASMRIDTPAGSILCDPWVNPAYFASWFPFPDNSRLDWDALGDCDYLYISHLHRDHFDAKNLREHVNKDAVVLLPDFPVLDLRNELEMLGFH